MHAVIVVIYEVILDWQIDMLYNKLFTPVVYVLELNVSINASDTTLTRVVGRWDSTCTGGS